MISVLNRYVPGRVFVMVAAENALIAASICALAWLPVWQKDSEGSVHLRSLQVGVAIALICQLTFYYFDLYDLRSISSKRALIGRLLSACGTCCLVLAASAVVFPWLRMRMGVLEVTFLCLVLLILLARLSLEWITRLFTAGERILVLGSGAVAMSIVHEIRGRSDLSLRLVGMLMEPEYGEEIPGAKRLGQVDELASVLEQHQADRIVVALQDRRGRLPVDLLLRYRSKGVRIEEAATLFEKLTGRVPIETIPARLLLFSDGFNAANCVENVVARSLAIVLSAFCLVVCLPLMLLVAAVIRIESRGPVFFRQERVGRDGAVFNILKFRSMRVDAEESTGPQWSLPNDPRITRIGSVIRKLRIDELPQLVNVLVGDMNLVGPRPERPYFVEQLKEQVPFYDLRHAVRPGLTGWAQVSYPYGASVEDVKRKLEFDLFYVKNASFALDLAILFQTVRTVLLGKGR